MMTLNKTQKNDCDKVPWLACYSTYSPDTTTDHEEITDVAFDLLQNISKILKPNSFN